MWREHSDNNDLSVDEIVSLKEIGFKKPKMVEIDYLYYWHQTQSVILWVP